MNIELPLEIWAELLGFLPRPYLGQIVPCIGSRQLAAIIQFFLHKYGTVKLGEMRIENDGHVGVGAVMYKWKRNGYGPIGPALPIDAGPASGMPENIKDFRALLFRYFPDTVQWLQKFADNHLFRNVNLHFQNRHQFRILRTLLPMLESIESVRIFDQFILADIYANIEQTGWLARARILQIHILVDTPPKYTDPIYQWLYTPIDHHPSNGPRVLLLSYSGYSGKAHVYALLERFEKDFLDAAECVVSYFIRLELRFPQTSIDTKSLHNAHTKQTFLIKDAADNTGRVLISRLPDQANSGWIAEKEKEVLEWKYSVQSRRIQLNTGLY